MNNFSGSAGIFPASTYYYWVSTSADSSFIAAQQAALQQFNSFLMSFQLFTNGKLDTNRTNAAVTRLIGSVNIPVTAVECTTAGVTYSNYAGSISWVNSLPLMKALALTFQT